jgi:hypothetical protein
MPRFAVCAVLFTASCLLVLQRPEPLAAQDKKDKIANLEKQLALLKQELKQVAQQNNTLKTANNKLQTEVKRLQGVLKKDRTGDAKDDKTIKSLQTTLDGYRSAGLVHVVVLKLKSDSPSTEAQSVIDDTYSQLSKIKTVRGVWAGKPASKGTPEAATDYTVALVFVFDNTDGLKAYLKDPIHDKFADKHLKKWETPLVYDFEPKKPTAP